MEREAVSIYPEEQEQPARASKLQVMNVKVADVYLNLVIPSILHYG